MADFVRGRSEAPEGGAKSGRSAPDYLFSTKGKDLDKKKKKKKSKKKVEEAPAEEDENLEIVMRQLTNVPKRVESLTFSKLAEGCGVLGVVTNVRKQDVRVVRGNAAAGSLGVRGRVCVRVRDGPNPSRTRTAQRMLCYDLVL